MYQFTETSLFVNPVKFIQSRSISISHHTIMCTNNTRKKTKPDDTLSIFMLQAFIIDQGDLFIKNCPQHFLILRLLLFSMRKKQVRFTRQQLIDRDLFYS